MPTYDTTRRFERDYGQLSEDQKKKFREAIAALVEDLEHHQGIFRKNLRVKRVQGIESVYEMTWDKDSDFGRATFQFGPSLRPGEPHVIWRRCGGHDIFKKP